MPAIDDITLNAYLDGELDAASAREVEASLAEDATLRRRLEQLTLATGLLRAAYAPPLHESVPDRFTASAAAPAARGGHVVTFPDRGRKPMSRRWMIPAAIAASIAVFTVGANYGYDQFVASGRGLPRLVAGDAWLDTVSNFHQVYARVYESDDRALVDISGDHADLINSFFGQKLRRNLQVPDLANHGFALQGGRLLVIQGQPSAQIVYVAGNGKTLALSIHAAVGRDIMPRLERRRGANVLHWRNDGFNYALVGEIEGSLLRAIAEEIAPKLQGA
ncbi:MAG: anti-sigma factor [Alphaproteobacteria bacterium]|nr:anti-sigma factor [Alphaproteobacteria bacterium]